MARMHGKRSGLTPARQAVLDVLQESTDHPTASEIYARVQERVPGVSYATIYNALSALADQRHITRWAYGDAATRYEGRKEPHSHIECERCGRLEDVHIHPPAAELRRAAEEMGFSVLGIHTVLTGLCQACRAQSNDNA